MVQFFPLSEVSSSRVLQFVSVVLLNCGVVAAAAAAAAAAVAVSENQLFILITAAAFSCHANATALGMLTRVWDQLKKASSVGTAQNVAELKRLQLLLLGGLDASWS